MSRWFRVSADIFEHELFAQSEMSEREAFLWLIAKAAWKDTRHRIGADMVPVPRGSLFVTLRELCSAWRWKSDHKVRAFLDVLERERMIEKDAGAGKTRVTICNYDKYQNAAQEPGADAAQDGRNEGALKIPEYQDTSLRSVSDGDARAPEAVNLEKPKKPPDKSTGTRLPDDWHPGGEWLDFTRQNGLSDDDAQRELEGFRDYWRGVPGSRGRKLDWLGTWRNRVRDVSARAKRQSVRPPAGRGGPEPQSTLAAYQRAAARFRDPSGFPGGGRVSEFDNGGCVELPYERLG